MADDSNEFSLLREPLEVPLVVSSPSSSRSSSRNDRFRLVRRESSSSSTITTCTTTGWERLDECDRQQQALCSGGRPPAIFSDSCCSIAKALDTLVTTSYLVEEPHVLLLSAVVHYDHPITVELDLSLLLEPVVSCHAFITTTTNSNNNSNNDIATGVTLQIVDRVGRVVMATFSLAADTNNNNNGSSLSRSSSSRLYVLLPATVSLVDVAERLLQVERSQQHQHTSSSHDLQASMVCHYDPRTVLLGWNPHLISVQCPANNNNNNSEVTFWEPSNRQHHSTSTTASSSSWFAGLLLTSSSTTNGGGGLNDNDDSSFVPPVAAVVSASGDNNDDNAHDPIVFTLHNDGSIRLWTSPTQAGVILPAHSSVLPRPDSWTGKVRLAAALYNHNQVYALAVAVTGSSSSSSLNKPCLAVLHGPVEVSNNNYTTSTPNPHLAQVQQWPSSSSSMMITVESIVNMAWQSHPTAALNVLVSTSSSTMSSEALERQQQVVTNATSGSTRQGWMIHYPHSLVRMISHQAAWMVPTTTTTNNTNSDMMALVQHVQPIDDDDVVDDDDDDGERHNNLESLLHRVDSYWLPFLVQLEPSTNALHWQFGQQSCSSTTPSAGNNNYNHAPHSAIARVAVAGVHEWRRRDEQRRRRMASKKNTTPRRWHRQQQQQQNESNDARGNSLYESLAPPEDHHDDDNTAESMDLAVTSTTTATTDDSTTSRDLTTAAAVQEHHERWRNLLLRLWPDLHLPPVTLCSSGGGGGGTDNSSSVIWLRPNGNVAMVTGVHISSNNNSNRYYNNNNGISDDDDNNVVDTITTNTTAATSMTERLDQVALNMMAAVANADHIGGDSTMVSLLKIERKIYSDLVTARLVWGADGRDMRAAFSSSLAALAQCSRSLLWDDQVLGHNKAEEFVSSLKAVDSATLTRYLLEPPHSKTLGGLGSLWDYHYDRSGQQGNNTNSTAASFVPPAAALVRTCLESSRRLSLGRLLVFTAVSQISQDVIAAASHAYLYTLSLIWASRQSIVIHHESTNSPATTSPRFAKRRHFGSGSAAKTNLLECSLRALAPFAPQVLLSDECERWTDSTVALATVFMERMYRWNNNVALPNNNHLDLCDLSMLPPTKSTLKYPRIALRLLVPAMICHVDSVNSSLRTKLLADVLLIEASRLPAKQAEVVSTSAIQRLGFSADNVVSGMENLEILHKHALINPDHLVTRVLTEIEQSITSMQAIYNEEALSKIPEYPIIWNMFFDVAIAGCQWAEAYAACWKNPVADRRLSCAQRLVRCMVDAGHLDALLGLVSSTSRESKNQRVETFRLGGDLYGIATNALEKASYRDLYHLRLVSKDEPLVDYPAALFALHADRGEWRKAAQAQDLRYVSARKALQNGPIGSGLDPSQMIEREVLIVDDMVMAATACADVILNVSDESLRFIVSGEHGMYPMLPANLLGANVDGNTSSPSRLHSKALVENQVKSTTLSRQARYMNVTLLRARSVRCSALSRVIRDTSSGSYALAKSTLLEEIPPGETDQAIIDRLFAIGYYAEGLALATALDEVSYLVAANVGVFSESLSHLLRNFLLPVATDVSSEIYRPTLSQLQAAYDSLGSSPTVFTATSHKKISLLGGSQIREAAMALVRQYVMVFSTKECPFAVDVASHLVQTTECAEALPSWLELLLIHGDDHESNLLAPGLFHKRPSKGSDAFLGDPSALLSLYAERGLFFDAVRVVELTLNTERRKLSSANRLPEKGNMDCVPYTKIDFLYNLMGVIANKRGVSIEDKQELLSSRSSLETCLENHFRLLNISEEGLRSARIVS